MYSGSHSGMFRLFISMEIFLRCPGLVTPMAVRSCRHQRVGENIPTPAETVRRSRLQTHLGLSDEEFTSGVILLMVGTS